jgi:hypothetical protein
LASFQISFTYHIFSAAQNEILVISSKPLIKKLMQKRGSHCSIQIVTKEEEHVHWNRGDDQ